MMQIAMLITTMIAKTMMHDDNDDDGHGLSRKDGDSDTWGGGEGNTKFNPIISVNWIQFCKFWSIYECGLHG